MHTLCRQRVALQTLICALLLSTPALADERQDIGALLDWFLANVEDVAAHERFWADDLVYTSSDGSRFGKASILEGMRAASDEAAAGPAYVAADVDIRLHDDAAVVAFRLVALAPGGGEAQNEYFNTGTLLKREGEWRVIAWQATRIPQEDDGSP